MVCLTQIAEMSASEIKKVHALEKELGVVLMALSHWSSRTCGGPGQEITKVEKDMGPTVVAYR